MHEDLYVTARQACEILGIDQKTLYTYVSRKKLCTLRVPGRRESLYWRSDVDLIAGEDPLPPHQTFRSTQTTRVTLITPQGPFYRGHSAIELADSHSLEDVAAILWEVNLKGCEALAPPDLQPLPLKAIGLPDRIQMSLLLAEAADPSSFNLDQALYARTAIRAVRLFAQQLTGALAPKPVALHELIADALNAPSAYRDLIRRTLVLNADHELSIATCAVRAVAASGASSYAVLSAGIASQKGVRVSRDIMKSSVEFLQCLFAAADARAVVKDWIAHHGSVPGFGFPTYQGPDPRATALLAACEHAIGREARFRRFADALRIAQELTGKHPGLALVATFLNFQLGGKSTVLPFSVIGRSVGWIAHAIERQTASHSRRRAAYVGPLPGYARIEVPPTAPSKQPLAQASRRTAWHPT